MDSEAKLSIGAGVAYRNAVGVFFPGAAHHVINALINCAQALLGSTFGVVVTRSIKRIPNLRVPVKVRFYFISYAYAGRTYGQKEKRC